MPRIEQYVATATVSIELKEFVGDKVVATYSVTRESGRHLSGSRGAERAIEEATVAAVASGKALTAGVQNAEDRRLK